MFSIYKKERDRDAQMSEKMTRYNRIAEGQREGSFRSHRVPAKSLQKLTIDSRSITAARRLHLQAG